MITPSPDHPRAIHWTERAACRGQDPRRWDTPDHRQPTNDARRAATDTVLDALATCDWCPVRRECADDTADLTPIGVIRAGVIYSHVGEPDPDCLDRMRLRPVAEPVTLTGPDQLAVAVKLCRAGRGQDAIARTLGCSSYVARRLSREARQILACEVPAERRLEDDPPDHAAVDLVLAGKRPYRELAPADRLEAYRRLRAAKATHNQIRERLHVSGPVVRKLAAQDGAVAA